MGIPEIGQNRKDRPAWQSDDVGRIHTSTAAWSDLEMGGPWDDHLRGWLHMITLFDVIFSDVAVMLLSLSQNASYPHYISFFHHFCWLNPHMFFFFKHVDGHCFDWLDLLEWVVSRSLTSEIWRNNTTMLNSSNFNYSYGQWFIYRCATHWIPLNIVHNYVKYKLFTRG